jgi:predicted O-methyltransferase YrrM
MFKIHLKYYARRMQPTLLKWSRNGWAAPAPAVVKREVLLRYGIQSAVWIETGTYLGETSSFLAKNMNSKQVYSLEPSPELFEFAVKKWKNITL